MRNLLIVDDEVYALQAMVEGVDWTLAGIDQVFSAGDAEEARMLLKAQPIDIMICDIEMPGETGLDLQSWVLKHDPGILTIFLTGHALFDYAQTAIKLNSFDYVLKPAPADQLLKVVTQAIDKIKDGEQHSRTNEVYETVYRRWQTHKPLLTERFWKDAVSQRLTLTPQKLKELAEVYGAEIDPQAHVLPIVISVEEWVREFDLRDEEVLEYALRNAAKEMLLGDKPGEVFQDHSGLNIVLAYEQDGISPTASELAEGCQSYIRKCGSYFYCRLSCYVGVPVAITELQGMLNELMDMERRNINELEGVFKYDVQGREAEDRFLPIPWFPELSVLFETGKFEDLRERVDEIFELLAAQERLSPEILRLYYHAMLHVVYPLLHQKNVSVRSLYPGEREPEESVVTRSLPQLKHWTSDLISRAIPVLYPDDHSPMTIVDQLCIYIENHIGEELMREELASFAGFNPAYLSRLFRKEKGMSLSEFILQRRVAKAKTLLSQSTVKVTDIAGKVGYYNYSHFTKMFKKCTGITPQEFRKQSRAVQI
ncbi:response regulator transcription factor [Paenibacillus pabuli]|uniref:response regulator transcription factor n=1 Tax=Paenibacillus pabuli TaxID=1472 RepID=UPI0007861584|nr:helix-turn-helix domain-containing protein [Paenibacillus pabuli]MEC0127979.1 helix-turn-helix domain-containing protein [Paenibacillus pabuli]